MFMLITVLVLLVACLYTYWYALATLDRSDHYEDVLRSAYTLEHQLNRIALFPHRAVVSPQDCRTAWKLATPAAMVYLGNNNPPPIEVLLFISPEGTYAELYSRGSLVPNGCHNRFDLSKSTAQLNMRIIELAAAPVTIGEVAEVGRKPHEVPQECAPRIFYPAYAN